MAATTTDGRQVSPVDSLAALVRKSTLLLASNKAGISLLAGAAKLRAHPDARHLADLLWSRETPQQYLKTSSHAPVLQSEGLPGEGTGSVEVPSIPTHNPVLASAASAKRSPSRQDTPANGRRRSSLASVGAITSRGASRSAVIQKLFHTESGVLNGEESALGVHMHTGTGATTTTTQRTHHSGGRDFNRHLTHHKLNHPRDDGHGMLGAVGKKVLPAEAHTDHHGAAAPSDYRGWTGTQLSRTEVTTRSSRGSMSSSSEGHDVSTELEFSHNSSRGNASSSYSSSASSLPTGASDRHASFSHTSSVASLPTHTADRRVPALPLNSSPQLLDANSHAHGGSAARVTRTPSRSISRSARGAATWRSAATYDSSASVSTPTTTTARDTSRDAAAAAAGGSTDLGLALGASKAKASSPFSVLLRAVRAAKRAEALDAARDVPFQTARASTGMRSDLYQAGLSSSLSKVVTSVRAVASLRRRVRERVESARGPSGDDAATATATSRDKSAASSTALVRRRGSVGSVESQSQQTQAQQQWLQFSTVPSAQLCYGSIIALESLDGWFLCVHPATGEMHVREPQIVDRSMMPFKRRKDPITGAVVEAPLFLFKIVNLVTPTATGLVSYGDPIWLQLVEGRGDDGWRSGSVIGPYLQGTLPMDNTAVDFNGNPASREQLSDPTFPPEKRALTSKQQMTFGLPRQQQRRGSSHHVSGLGSGDPECMPMKLSPPGDAAAEGGLCATTAVGDASAGGTDTPTQGYTPLVDDADEDARAVRAHIHTIKTLIGGVLEAEGAAERGSSPRIKSIKSSSSTCGGSRSTNTSTSCSTRMLQGASSDAPLNSPSSSSSSSSCSSTPLPLSRVGTVTYVEAADGIFPGPSSGTPTTRRTPPTSSGSSAAYSGGDAVTTTTRPSAAAAMSNIPTRSNPLDKIGTRLGYPCPIAAHVPPLGSVGDYLNGPQTAFNPRGVYTRLDPGYERLHALANARSTTVGKWTLQVAAKEVTSDGFLVGGLGIEMSVLTAGDHEPAAQSTARAGPGAASSRSATNSSSSSSNGSSGINSMAAPAQKPAPGDNATTVGGKAVVLSPAAAFASSHNYVIRHEPDCGGASSRLGRSGGASSSASERRRQHNSRSATASMRAPPLVRSAAAASSRNTNNHAAAVVPLGPVRGSIEGAQAVDFNASVEDAAVITVHIGRARGGGGGGGGSASGSSTNSGADSSRTPNCGITNPVSRINSGGNKNSTTNREASSDAGGQAGAVKAAARTAVVPPERAVVLNYDTVYIEQDWFYISSAVATGGIASSIGAASGSSCSAPLSGTSPGAQNDQSTSLGIHRSSPASSSNRDDAVVTVSPRASAGVGPPGQQQPGGCLLPQLPQAADDSSLRVHQPPDGISGGNRRATYLQPHTSGLAGEYKVERRGVFRIRVLAIGSDSMGSGGSRSGSMLAREDRVVLRARDQLREAEARRIGDTSVQQQHPAYLQQPPAAATALGWHTSRRPSSLGLLQSRSTQPLSRRAQDLPHTLRSIRSAAAASASAKYLAYEALKYAAADVFFSARLNDVSQELAAEWAINAKARSGGYVVGGESAALLLHTLGRQLWRPQPVNFRELRLATICDPVGSGTSSSSDDNAMPQHSGLCFKSSTSTSSSNGGVTAEPCSLPGHTHTHTPDSARSHDEHPDAYAHLCGLCRVVGGKSEWGVDLCSLVRDARQRIELHENSHDSHIQQQNELFDGAIDSHERDNASDIAHAATNDDDRDISRTQMFPVLRVRVRGQTTAASNDSSAHTVLSAGPGGGIVRTSDSGPRFFLTQQGGELDSSDADTCLEDDTVTQYSTAAAAAAAAAALDSNVDASRKAVRDSIDLNVASVLAMAHSHESESVTNDTTAVMTVPPTHSNVCDCMTDDDHHDESVAVYSHESDSRTDDDCPSESVLVPYLTAAGFSFAMRSQQRVMRESMERSP